MIVTFLSASVSPKPSMSSLPPRDPSQEIRVPVEPLRQFVMKALIKKSMFQFDAETAAARLIDADLRGQSAGGVRSLPAILDAMDAGDVDPRARILVEQETPAIAVLCGSTAVGQVAATKGMQMAMEKARNVGIGAVTVHHSQPLGVAVTYSLLAAREGLIGFCTSSSGRATLAGAGTTGAVTADHPWAWAFPTAEGSPLAVETTCGSLPWSDLPLWNLYGSPLPPGVALDESGAPTTDPAAARTLVPAGCGHGLAIAAAMLAGCLAGGKLCQKKTRSATAENSEHFLLAIDIARFTDPERFATRSSELRESIRTSPPSEGTTSVEAPGDRAAIDEEDRRTLGIPLHQKDVEELARRATKLRVEHPF